MEDEYSESINSRTKAADVRKAAGYSSWADWNLFTVCSIVDHIGCSLITLQRITQQYAKEFVSENYSHFTSWSIVDRRLQNTLYEKVNAALAEQTMKTVSFDIFYWRMGQIMPAVLKSHKQMIKDERSTEGEQSEPEPAPRQEQSESPVATSSTTTLETSESSLATTSSTPTQERLPGISEWYLEEKRREG